MPQKSATVEALTEICVPRFITSETVTEQIARCGRSAQYELDLRGSIADLTDGEVYLFACTGWLSRSSCRIQDPVDIFPLTSYFARA
jgi:hypothetical protein